MIVEFSILYVERDAQMNRFFFFRKPIKPILFTVLLCLFTAAALVFTLQYVLDGLSMEYFVECYAYVGTVYSRL